MSQAAPSSPSTASFWSEGAAVVSQEVDLGAQGVAPVVTRPALVRLEATIVSTKASLGPPIESALGTKAEVVAIEDASCRFTAPAEDIESTAGEIESNH